MILALDIKPFLKKRYQIWISATSYCLLRKVMRDFCSIHTLNPKNTYVIGHNSTLFSGSYGVRFGIATCDERGSSPILCYNQLTCSKDTWRIWQRAFWAKKTLSRILSYLTFIKKLFEIFVASMLLVDGFFISTFYIQKSSLTKRFSKELFYI